MRKNPKPKRQPADAPAWDPRFGWEILRRSSAYRKAVDQFVVEAGSAKDKNAINLFLSFHPPDGPIDRETDRRMKPYYLDTQSINWAKARTAGTLSSLTFPRHSENEKQNSLNMLRSSKYLIKFQKKFGRYLSYPVPWELNQPNWNLFASVWQLSPILTDPLLSFHPSAVTLSLTINLDFSDTAVHKAAHDVISERLNEHRKSILPSGWISRRKKWSDFKEYMKAWDIWCEYPIGHEKHIGYQAIGDRLKKKTLSNPASRKKWAENAINHIEKEWVPFFRSEGPE